MRNLYLTGLLRSPEDGESGGGGGDAPAPRTFTQEEFDRTIGKIKADERKRFGDYDTIKAQASKMPELEQQLADLRSQLEDAGKTAEQKSRAAEERAAKLREKELKELSDTKSVLEKQLADAQTVIKSERLSAQLGAALDEGRVLQKARAKAISLLAGEAEIEFGDDGKISRIVYEGTEFTSAKDAAQAFLKSNDYLLSSGTVPPRSGITPPNAGGRPGADGNASPQSLLSAGLRARNGGR